LRSPLPIHETNAELRQLGEIIRPTLERQFLTLALLQHHGSGKLTREMLEESGHLLAQRLSLLYEFNSPEFSEKALFANVIRNLISADLLRLDESGYLHFDQRISLPAKHTELLLSPAVRHSIERIARSEGTTEQNHDELRTVSEAPTILVAASGEPASPANGVIAPAAVAATMATATAEIADDAVPATADDAMPVTVADVTQDEIGLAPVLIPRDEPDAPVPATKSAPSL
jgi:hypothetical protein